ncbi:MAG: class I tRNA ligase family protein, partial [Candidatus Parvarchaeum sp.]|nr:class I tRNA ligase family protein [Candidatus Parvarchaeum tengchongense]
QEIIEKFEKKDLYSALNLIFDSIRKINKYVNDKEPWKLQGKELANVLYNSLEAIRVIAIFLKPFMPSTAEKIEKKLGIKEQLLSDAVFREFTTKVERGENLFNKVI